MGITTTVENDALAQSRGREAGLVDVAEKARATLCACRSDWAEILLLAARGKDSTTPGFCGDHLKRMLGRAGYNPTSYSGHSLRARFATQAAINWATELEIIRQTGHSSLVTVRRYIRVGQLSRAAEAAKPEMGITEPLTIGDQLSSKPSDDWNPSLAFPRTHPAI